MADDAPRAPSAVAAVVNKLENILQLARETKKATTIDPPLLKSDIGDAIDSLIEGVFGAQAEKDFRFATFEAAARKIFYDTVSSTSIWDPEFIRIWDLCDVVAICAVQGQCDAQLVFYLIEELFDSQTTDGCRIVLDYLESRGERLLQKELHRTQLIVLRACNELLRRLSRAEDAILCGRVFFFLFQNFPLGDKSAVNLRGEFHVDNVTTFETLPPPEAQTLSEQMDVETTSEQPKDKPEVPSQDKETSRQEPIGLDGDTILESSQFYPIFWRLQQDFSVPTRLFEDANFNTFRDGLEKTLTKFQKTPVVVQTKAVNDAQRGTKRKHGESGADDLANNLNSKYLTSRELFELELSDLAFQRHILVQGLILLDFLLSLTEKAKKKLNDPAIGNKSLLYQYTLSEENADWAISTRTKIADYIKNGPDGNFYYRMVDTVLSRDKNWVRWKQESCPPIFRESVPSDQYSEAQKGAKQATATKRLKSRNMGAIDLTFLSEADAVKGLERLRDPARYTAPSIPDLVKGITGDELDLEMAMTEQETQSLEAAKSSKTWRALRTATRSALGKLDRAETGKSLQDVFKSTEDAQEAQDSLGEANEISGLEDKTSNEVAVEA